MAFLGLACLTCVAVVKFARTGTDEAVESVSHLHNEQTRIIESVQDSSTASENEFSFANRIPAIDDATQAYPVQLAAYDSIPWISDTVTPNRISSPNVIPAEPISDRVQIASLPGELVFVPLEREAKEAPAESSIWTHPDPIPIQNSLPVLQNAIVIPLKDVQPKGRRIPGFTQNPEANPKVARANQLDGNEITVNPYYPGPVAAIPAGSNQLSSVTGTPKRSNAGYPLGNSPNDKTKPVASGQRLDSKKRGNSQRAVISNPYLLPNAQSNQSIASFEKGTDNQNNADSTDSNDFSIAAANDAINSSVADIGHEVTKGTTDDDFVIGSSELARDSSPQVREPTTLDQPYPKTPLDAPQRSFPRATNVATRMAVAPKTSTPDPTASPAATEPNPQTAPQTESNDHLPSVLRGASDYVLAAEPKVGEHWYQQRPVTDPCASLIDPVKDDFSPDPIPADLPFDPYQEMQVYEGKKMYATQRPLVELGRPWYQLGQLSPGYSWFGKHNNAAPQFLVYGDVRTALASSTNLGDNVSELAYEVNLDFNLKLTSTERFHMFMSPLDNGVQNTRWLLDEGDFDGIYDANIDFGYFEGDLGAMVGGLINRTMPFDLPIALGIMPLVIQNGVWMEDAFLGAAATIPARTIPRFNVSNMDVTFFAAFDKINSDGFPQDDSASRMYGVASFIDAMNGYFEIDYAFLEDRTFDDRSYHNIGLAFTRRFGRLLSNSTRVIVNAGQSTDVVENTADGVLLLSENSLITGAPSTVVPYLNLFAGFDRPQSAARAVQAGGVLRNTGILFEFDGMTNYPTLDATANDTYGGALGMNLLASDFTQQLIVEMAALGVMNEDANRIAPGPQYGVAFRYQLPLTNALIFRSDGMYGFLEDRQDVRGLRFELRHKY